MTLPRPSCNRNAVVDGNCDGGERRKHGGVAVAGTDGVEGSPW